MRNVKELAAQLSQAFTRGQRANGDEYIFLKDGSPQWMTDVIRTVHGDKLPDDTVYRFVEQCADAISESDEEPFEAIAAIEPDIYTSDLTGWLAARVDHTEYANEALREIGGFGRDAEISDLLQYAQTLQIREIGDALIGALESVDVPEVQS